MRVDGNHFRRERMKLFLSLLGMPSSKPLHILDIGGTASYWRATEDLWKPWPLRFTIVNLDVEPSDDGRFAIRAGNACSMPEYADNTFDLVHSNSVIEHVGHWAEMSAMASEVRRLAPSYYLQTPNFWFPIEPHYRTVGYQWLPESTRASILTKRKLGFRGPTKSFDAAMRDIQSVNLLTAAQMRELFPDAELRRERFFGLAKSLIAIRAVA
jgi:hypothetical protein